ncbi:hypothetical protein JAAARDRAFT_81852 [Jaapia argillacea MUCL 33604]|uniref:NAD-dependent epimerase/dehydratase domain-containing protein n=1 Tax=Jaapia argillacea MUCL 33604 TaxID=933084 RepID=A0A067PHK7_9AGAM|nr:hypothetical protein JAAARDRAFT_81852 [Jaapia argillacea MUCL 33604]
MAALSTKPLILVTGASGFLGSYVVYEALEAGYRVRGTARSGKVDLVKKGYAKYEDCFDVTPIDDVASSDFTVALKGVEAVIHVASPIAGRASAEKLLDADKAGIKKFVVMSSVVALTSPLDPRLGTNYEYTDQDWNPATKEEALKPDAGDAIIYSASKALSEKAVWDFVEEHPDIDVTTILPSYIFGPFAPGFLIPEKNLTTLSTNGYVYSLINGSLLPNIGVGSVDIRDIARLHVAALTPQGDAYKKEQKRVLVPREIIDWKAVAEYVAEKRPELKDRLPSTDGVANLSGPFATVDTHGAKELLESFIPWQETILDAVDDFIRLEKQWSLKA